MWEKYMKDQTMNEYQRLEHIKMKAQLLEERAKQDEKVIRNARRDGDNAENVEKSIAVNDLYLGAIQAKLKLLDQI